MSQPLAPRPSEGPPSPGQSSGLQRKTKITSACLACKARKTKCSGGLPCEACAQRNTPCQYDFSEDKRRKIASKATADALERTTQILAQTHEDLRQTQETLASHQQLLGGMIAIFRVASHEETNDLVRLVRSGVDMSQLAAHVRNAMRMSPEAREVFRSLNFLINGPRELPSPEQLLSEMPVRHAALDGLGSPDLMMDGQSRPPNGPYEWPPP